MMLPSEENLSNSSCILMKYYKITNLVNVVQFYKKNSLCCFHVLFLAR